MEKPAEEPDRPAVEYAEGWQIFGKPAKRGSTTEKYGAAIEAM
jgi:hypothetical protein